MKLDQKIVVCGIGGQGVLFLTRVLYEIARSCGVNVLGSETHGMSQRGGSVTSHIKIGDYYSPMVRSGTADLLIILKAEETYGNLRFLKKRGKVVLNAAESFHIRPVVEEAMKAEVFDLFRTDATSKAVRLGNPLSANLILLSAAIKNGNLPVNEEVLIKAVESVTPSKRLSDNMKAVKVGLSC